MFLVGLGVGIIIGVLMGAAALVIYAGLVNSKRNE